MDDQPGTQATVADAASEGRKPISVFKELLSIALWLSGRLRQR